MAKWFREYEVTFKGTPSDTETSLTRVDNGMNIVEPGAGYKMEVLIDGIEAPVTGGTPEQIEWVKVKVDDEDIIKFVFLPGSADKNILPAYNKYIDLNVRKVIGEVFGMPLYALGDIPVSQRPFALFNARWLKPVKRISVTAKAVSGATITNPVIVKLRVVEYSPETIERILGGRTLHLRWSRYDPRLDYRVTVEKEIRDVVEEWANLPGGLRQKEQIVMPFIRWSTNAQSISVGENYPYSFSMGKVTYAENDLDFEPERGEAWIIKRIGVIPHSNSQELWINTPEGDIPDPHWRIEPQWNDLPFPGQDPDANAPMRSLPTDLMIAKIKHTFYTKTSKGTIPAGGQFIAVSGVYVKGIPM